MAVPAVALLLAETTYKLVIRTNSGEEITLQTKDIQKMEFVEKSDQPVKLATPVPTATRNADNSYTVSWNARLFMDMRRIKQLHVQDFLYVHLARSR